MASLVSFGMAIHVAGVLNGFAVMIEAPDTNMFAIAAIKVFAARLVSIL